MGIPKNYIPKYGADLTLWALIPKLISWKLEQRKFLKSDNKSILITAINASTIIDCCNYIEGVMNKILRDILYCKKFPPRNKYITSLIENEERKLDSAQWKKYCEIFELSTGKKFKERIPAQVIESINTLFSFRNMIIHGKEISIEYYKKPNGELLADITNGKFEQVYSHLKTYKILLQDKSNLKPEDLINNNVANYFHEMTISFVQELIKLPTSTERSYFEYEILESMKLVNDAT